MANRRGFALIVVVVLMGMGTALMFSAMNGALAEDDIAQIGTIRRRALVAAEAALWTTLGDQAAPMLRIAPLGQVSRSSRRVGDVTLITTVEKVDTSSVWIVASATIQRAGSVARHRIGISVLIPHDTSDLALHLVPERAWAELF